MNNQVKLVHEVKQEVGSVRRGILNRAIGDFQRRGCKWTTIVCVPRISQRRDSKTLIMLSNIVSFSFKRCNTFSFVIRVQSTLSSQFVSKCRIP